MDRVLVPASSEGTVGGARLRHWAAHQGLPVDALRGPGGGTGFDGSLEYLSATTSRATAVSAAKMIDYPTSTLHLAERGEGLRVPVLVTLGLLLTVAVGTLPTLARRASLTSRTRSDER